jgi:phenylpropionate dioxygenase-like ring-hydroxylating dioxygenase large terminal subunit
MLAAEKISELTVDPNDLGSIVDAVLAGSSEIAGQSVTLPPAAYMSQAFYDLEVQKIFKKEWLCVGHVSQVKNIGDYFTIRMLGEPLVVVRGNDDRIRVLSAVCLHRWAPIASGTGNTRIFSCPFHKWGYALDGQLLGAPFMEQAEDFDPKSCRLPELRSEVVPGMGLIFITFSDTVDSISDRLEELSERCRGWGMEDLIVADVMEQDNKYNWKIQVETFMECYHHIGAHQHSLEPYKPGRLSYCEDTRPGWTVCYSVVRPDLPPDEPKDKWYTNNLILVYPLMFMSGNPHRMSVMILQPEGPNRTRSTRLSFAKAEEIAAPDFEEKRAKARERGNVINLEDNAVNDMQQIGAASQLASFGRLSHLENCVWHLAEYVRRRIVAN